MNWGILMIFIMGASTYGGDPTTERRTKMVQTQIKARGVKDSRVLKAMETVPRHEFVPEKVKPLAYSDSPLPIGEDQTISQPYIVAFMTEAAKLGPKSRVLEIGTGSGYQAAVLSKICKEVYSVEIVKPLAESAQKVFDKLKYKNIFVRVGDGYQGWAEKAPYDAIIVTAAPDHVPKALIDQLKVGGHLIIPVGGNKQELQRLTKTADSTKLETLIPVVFVPMTGEAEKKFN